MATRFETLDGKSLGMKFAGKDGAKLHLSKEELDLLFSLEDDAELLGGGASWTAGELKDLFFEMKDSRADLDDMKRWGRKSLEDSLCMSSESRLFLDEDGQLCSGKLFRR